MCTLKMKYLEADTTQLLFSQTGASATTRRMAGELSDAAGKAAAIALKLGSSAADAISFAADVGEEVPLIGPVLKALTAIREQVETVKNSREQLAALEERCTYVAAFVVVKFKENRGSRMDVTLLEDCVKDVRRVVERCRRRGRVWRVIKASSDTAEIAKLNACIDRLAGDFGLASFAILERKVNELKAKLVSFLWQHHVHWGLLVRVLRGNLVFIIAQPFYHFTNLDR